MPYMIDDNVMNKIIFKEEKKKNNLTNAFKHLKKKTFLKTN